ncbi:methylmalonyl Co-A mutase-associated GTPase MeaB [Cloacibacillus porcorum]|uniref:methylmalonyl Co-A mutase-associated GTPase MeaB n=1 Tax=Cloacibacillus porcorum TaxID=1197717 RepID=UPI001459219D|nr:methylmalonyl Co-A mutase-associated GTPase MeaB [Cloacibacillus porcorum]MCC8183338.1 methylmalonyl Co-A mutase-associated GTPase MeaB [Cloacibacillus porcorum]MCD8233741.1 methylmalonyl Co-A mutase-associated GTPase MeaB [Cloacibacillus porcorum]MDD7649672.1 methylmalonyl Co-A mutase-associated GTPase MeaB [Cloacibacillus porcorum]MDY4094937.1 methylmalonyl Co-A mutase-associated GTPase MeaB [Cloacibacillus porcorum]MDY5391103.1 methylmalonyl Co-A mutase-associated GTPase MeaB [Cloacibaci
MNKLLERALAGDTRSIGRLISLVEADSPTSKEIMKAVYPKTGRAQVIGITGSPGAGKSTFVNRLIAQFRAEGKQVGVIAIDPSSPFTGGAILGDRLRMQDHAVEEGVFIRSMGSRGNLGGVSRGTHEGALILDACGFDVVIIETVGVGQSEVDIVKIADTVCLILTPGMGDDVQIMKAGIMEIADVFVVNKADKEGADKVAADVQVMLKMLGEREWVPPVALVSSNKNTGIDEVKDIIKNHSAYLHNSEEGKRRRWSQLEMEVEAILRGEISLLVENAWKERRTDSLMDELSSRKADPYTLAGEIIQKVVK